MVNLNPESFTMDIGLEVTNILSKNELGDKCKLFAIGKLPPGKEIALHSHTDDTEAYYIIQGDALYNDNGVETMIHAGSVIYCPLGESHGTKNVGDKDLIFVSLIINK